MRLSSCFNDILSLVNSCYITSGYRSTETKPSITTVYLNCCSPLLRADQHLQLITSSATNIMQLLQKQIAGAPVAQQRRNRVHNARQTHVRVMAAAATEVKLNTTKSDEVSNPQQQQDQACRRSQAV